MGKIVIIYFSATGNTKIVANEIINNFSSKGFNTELIPIENVDKIKSIDLSDKILGIGFPIYGCTYPH
jgi:flavodoxin